MIKRTVEFTVGDGVITPSVPLYGGVKGEHNATLLHVELTDDVYTAGDKVRLSFTTGDGTILSSDLFEADAVRTDENGAVYIEYELPQLLTVAAGQLCVRVVTSTIGLDDTEEQTDRSPEMVLYFDEAEVENGTPFWTGVSEMLHRTVTASGAAVNAQGAAQAAQTAAEAARDAAQGYAASAQDAKDDAEAARSEAQAAQKAAETARNDAKDYADYAEGRAEGAIDAKTAAVTARDEAQGFSETAESARNAAVTNAGKAGNFATAAQQAQSAAEAARDTAQSAADSAEAARSEAEAQANLALYQAGRAETHAASAWEAVQTPGRQGEDGKSAYQIAVDNGFEGDEAAWLASLKGKDGVGDEELTKLEEEIASLKKHTELDHLLFKGEITSGQLGSVVASVGDTYVVVYPDEHIELAVARSDTSSTVGMTWFTVPDTSYLMKLLQSLWTKDVEHGNRLDALESADTLCYKGTIAGTLLVTLTDQQIGDVWFVVSSGENGNRFCVWDGEEWTPLATGTQGEAGADGITPHIGANGNWYIGENDTGVKAQGEDGAAGKNGKSAYEIAMDHGEARDEEEWLASLKGEKGDKGDTGATGADGKDYILTDADKEEIAGMVDVPVVTQLPPHKNTPHKPQTVIVNACQDAATYKGSGLTVNTTDNIMGSQCVNVTGYIRFTKNVFDVKNNHLVIKARINHLDPNVQLYVKMAHTTSAADYSFHVVTRYINETNTPFGEWREYTVPYMSYVDTSSANVDLLDYTAINDIFVGVQDNSGTGGTGDFDIQFIGLRPNMQSKGIVSFAFDDSWKTQYDGIRILAERGLTGTIFHIIGGDEENYLTTAELKELVDRYGADIEVHNSTEYQNMTDEQLAAHWTEYQTFLKENGLSDGRHMAYPGGSHPTRVVELARKYFDSCRTIQGFMNETFPPYDNYRMRALSAITDANKSVAKAAIDAAVANKTWAILVFHKIESMTVSDNMQCSPEVLAELADYAIASGARIMNYAEVFETNGGGSGVDISDVISALPVYNGEVE